MRNCWRHKLIGIASLLISISGCEKQDDIQEGQISELSGTWIELTNKNDTIVFGNWTSQDVFLLQRGFESRNGSILPKYGSGPYVFIIKQDSIMLNSMFSSLACYSSYYFQLNLSKDMFEIGNFYDNSIPSSQHIVFYKFK